MQGNFYCVKRTKRLYNKLNIAGRMINNANFVKLYVYDASIDINVLNAIKIKLTSTQNHSCNE
jgi:hypothetical protein